jgi:hypothetical protein
MGGHDCWMGLGLGMSRELEYLFPILFQCDSIGRIQMEWKKLQCLYELELKLIGILKFTFPKFWIIFIAFFILVIWEFLIFKPKYLFLNEHSI